MTNILELEVLDDADLDEVTGGQVNFNFSGNAALAAVGILAENVQDSLGVGLVAIGTINL